MKITVIFRDPSLKNIVVEGVNADYHCNDNWIVVTSDQYSSTPKKKRYTFPSCVILYIIEEND